MSPNLLALMRIGIPKEIKNSENRVAIVLAGVKSLVLAGHEVRVQESAGLGSGITDAQYRSAGAKMVPTAKDAWDADMVIKVKEPQAEEFQFLRPGLILYTYLHLANELELGKELLKKKVRGIAYETVQLPNGSLPLLKPMSEVAGRLAPQVGANLLEKRNGGSGVLLGGVPGVNRGNVTIIGGGVAGINAAKVAIGLGAQVTVIEKSPERLAYLDDIFNTSVNTRMSDPVSIEECVADSDLVVGSVLIPGAKAPRLVTREMIKKMRPGSVVVDVAIDQGGCFETSRPTSHTNSSYVEEGVIHYCVTNMPGVVARTSTFALTNHTLTYGLMIANDPVNCFKNNPALALGVNTWDGHCVYAPVARDLNFDYVPLDKVLSK
jgi:alanine dehydrogenase